MEATMVLTAIYVTERSGVDVRMDRDIINYFAN